MSPIGQSSCAGAKPELPVCEQGRGGGHDLTTIERQGGCEKEQPKVGPKGEGVGTTESKDTECTEVAGLRFASQAGAEAPLALGLQAYGRQDDQEASELARDSENASLTRSASDPALAAEPPIADERALMAEGAKLVPSSATEKTLDASSPATSYPPLATSASPIVFGFYGFARHEQGVDVLMRALEILKDKGELGAEFRIVWPKAFQMPDGSWMDREMFGHLGSNLRFYENPLSPEEYLRALAETDWLILPYRVGSYEGRCSRISIEACVMGIPVIYTNGTDLEEVVRSHGEGIGVPEEDPGALATAIRLAVQENRAFKEKAVVKEVHAQAIFSGRYFLETILGKN